MSFYLDNKNGARFRSQISLLLLNNNLIGSLTIIGSFPVNSGPQTQQFIIWKNARHFENYENINYILYYIIGVKNVFCRKKNKLKRRKNFGVK